MSWVVAASIFSMILSPTSAGLVNDVLMKLHLITDNIYFLGDQKWWRFSYYIINVWKDTGWGTIIFMATLAGISPELYEAASMDGANRFQKMIYITLPALNNTIVTVLVLNLAKVMNLFESVLYYRMMPLSRYRMYCRLISIRRHLTPVQFRIMGIRQRSVCFPLL